MSKNKYLFPFILVTSLFFLWGFAYGLLDVLNKHFQVTLNITKTRSTLLQAAYFGAYFIIGLIGTFVNKFDYKKGIIFGLLMFSLGAFLFYPAANAANFNFFLIALFILAAGCACLETTANPYVTVLGDPATSANRLNLSQCFNGVGSFFGPVIASQLFFSNGNNDNLDSVKNVYLIIAVVVLLISFLFMRTKLPEIKEEVVENLSEAEDKKPLSAHKHFIGGVIAQFFYVAAQVGVAALFINYCTETKVDAGKDFIYKGVQSLADGLCNLFNATHLSFVTISNATAAILFSVGLILFTVGRFVGTALMKKIAANKLLTIYAIINVLLCLVVVFNYSFLSIASLMLVFFFESIMFPTIFALGLKGIGSHTKKGASFMIMSIVGGALVPYFMGVLSDKYSTSFSYIIPMLCFVIVAWYGWVGYRVKGNNDKVQVNFAKH
ncbi:sugar MFS transporter [Arachidicoccus sp.]|uniref:sugar MFS transporter n=1 Tax=Arachidicoccus sp. TaxID=1872624 RepID=UPI003D22D410